MKKNSFILSFPIFFIIAAILYSCAVPQHIADKSGAQLWAENCQRCHNTPPPNAFNDMQWEVATTHMTSKLVLTEDEEKKIVEFLKSGN
jgi:hypothetical protein